MKKKRDTLRKTHYFPQLSLKKLCKGEDDKKLSKYKITNLAPSSTQPNRLQSLCHEVGTHVHPSHIDDLKSLFSPSFQPTCLILKQSLCHEVGTNVPFSSKVLTHLLDTQGATFLRLPRLYVSHHRLISLVHFPGQFTRDKIFH